MNSHRTRHPRRPGVFSRGPFHGSIQVADFALNAAKFLQLRPVTCRIGSVIGREVCSAIGRGSDTAISGRRSFGELASVGSGRVLVAAEGKLFYRVQALDPGEYVIIGSR